jgi:hypothetical protein
MAELKDCSKLKEPKERMECIEKNLAQVNASLESVARELRAKVEALTQAIGRDCIKRGDVVTISSVDPTQNNADRHQCLTWIDDKSAPRTQACGGGAVYAKGWKLS